MNTFAYNTWISYIYIYIYYICVCKYTYTIYVYTPIKHVYYNISRELEKLMNLFHFLQTLTISDHVQSIFFRVCSSRYILQQTLNESLTWRGKKKPMARHLDSWHSLAQAPKGVPPTRAGDFNLVDHRVGKLGINITSSEGEEIWAWFEAVTSS